MSIIKYVGTQVCEGRLNDKVLHTLVKFAAWAQLSVNRAMDHKVYKLNKPVQLVRYKKKMYWRRPENRKLGTTKKHVTRFCRII